MCLISSTLKPPSSQAYLPFHPPPPPPQSWHPPSYPFVLSVMLLFGEAPRLWPPDVKSRVIGKDFDAGKDLGQEEKASVEDEMVGWHH